MTKSASTATQLEPESETPSRRLPGEPAVWVFIFGDLLSFTFVFLVFAWERAHQLDVFSAGQSHLDQRLGLLNTFVMLTSSWFAAGASQMARASRAASCANRLTLVIACASVFVVVKYFEWSAKVEAGFNLQASDFFVFYYAVTGVHLFHVLAGAGILLWLITDIRSGPLDARKIRNIECGVSFWHVVDLLWIVLFALLYLAV